MAGQESAEILALQVLGWLAAQPEEMARFLSASGLGIGDLPALVQTPAFLAALLDHLLEQDARVIAFCDSAGLPYGAPMAARAALPGGQAVHWT